MASVGHVIVGACAASMVRGFGLARPWTSVVIISGLSLLPDADVLGFPLGVAYEDPLGHRGATHSLLFALIVALVASAIARARHEPWRRVLVLVGAVVASHGLLDMLTDGGLGVALFFPSNERYFFPWQPIPVSPIGRGFISQRGLEIALTELAYFSPLIALATALHLIRSRRSQKVDPR